MPACSCALWIAVDVDLSTVAACVQAAHVAACATGVYPVGQATPMRIVTAGLGRLATLAHIPGAVPFTEPDLAGLVTSVAIPACHPAVSRWRELADLSPTGDPDDRARHRRERLLRDHPADGCPATSRPPAQMYAAHVASLPLAAQMQLADSPTVADGNRQEPR